MLGFEPDPQWLLAVKNTSQGTLAAIPDVKKGVVEVDLKDGDLLTLEGLMQKSKEWVLPQRESKGRLLAPLLEDRKVSNW